LGEDAVGVAVGGDLFQGAEGDGLNLCVAGEGECLRGADEGAVSGAHQSGAGLELVGGEGEQDGGADAAAGGELVGADQRQQSVAESVVAALGGGAPVGLPVFGGGGSGEGVQDGEQCFGADGVQFAGDLSRSVGALLDGEVAAAVAVVFGGQGAVGVQGVEQAPRDHPQGARVVLSGLLDEEGFDGGVVLDGDRGREFVDGLDEHLGVGR